MLSNLTNQYISYSMAVYIHTVSESKNNCIVALVWTDYPPKILSVLLFFFLAYWYDDPVRRKTSPVRIRVGTKNFKIFSVLHVELCLEAFFIFLTFRNEGHEDKAIEFCKNRKKISRNHIIDLSETFPNKFF